MCVRIAILHVLFQSEVGPEALQTLKCDHCPFEIPLRLDSSQSNMERHIACHEADEQFKQVVFASLLCYRAGCAQYRVSSSGGGGGTRLR